MEVRQAFCNPKKHIEPCWPVEVLSNWSCAIQKVPQVAMRHVLEDCYPLVLLTAAAQQWDYMGVLELQHCAYFHIEFQVPLNTMSCHVMRTHGRIAKQWRSTLLHAS